MVLFEPLICIPMSQSVIVKFLIITLSPLTTIPDTPLVWFPSNVCPIPSNTILFASMIIAVSVRFITLSFNVYV